MQPIIVIPFASEVHKKDYYIGVFDILRRYMVKYGVEIHSDIVTNTEDAEVVGKKYAGFLPILVVLTGGTSSYIDQFIDSGNFDRVILFAHSEHNSLASAISAKVKIERKGLTSLIYHCSNINSRDCAMRIDKMFRVAKAVATVIGSRIGLIVDRSTKNDIEETFESKFGASIYIKTFDQLLNEMKDFRQEEVNEVKKYIAKALDIDPADSHLDPIARLYLVLRSFIQREKLDAVTIDCFPFILSQGVTPCIPLALLNTENLVAGCEADLPALLGMTIAKAITDRSGWIANIVDLLFNRCALAHCTIALDIAKDVKLTTHFETGNPYALIGEYRGDVVTVLSIDRDFTIAAIALGRVIASGNLGLAACRSQMIIEFEYPIEYLSNVAPNNHHIVIAGDHRDVLSEALYMLGLDVIEYKEFWVSGRG